MINSQWLELPISRTNFYGPKNVRAIEVRLWIVKGKTIESTEHSHKTEHSNVMCYPV